MVLLAAQDKPNGRLLSRPALVSVQPAQIQLHLALVGGVEAAQLQLYGHQPELAAAPEYLPYLFLNQLSIINAL